MQATKIYEQRAMQHDNSNNTTKRRMIQTTRLLFAIWKYEHHINKNETQRRTTISLQKNTTQNSNTANLQAENKKRIAYM